MGMAAEIPDDATSEEAFDAPADDAEIEGDSQEAAELHEQAADYVGKKSEEDDTDEPAKPAKKEAKKESGDEEDEARPDEKRAKKPEKKSDRSNERIRALVERSKQAEQKTAQRERQFQSYIQQFQQREREMEKRYVELERQHAVAAREMELIRQRELETQEAALDPLEKAMRVERRKATSEVESRLKAEYDKRFAEADQRSQQLMEMLEEQKREAAIKERMGGYDREADLATQTLFKGFPPEKAAAIQPDIKTWVLNIAATKYGRQQQPLQLGAREFDRVATAYVLTKLKLQNSANAEVRKNGEKIPPSAPAGKKPTKGNGHITQAQARKEGFGSALEGAIARNPPAWAR